MSSPVTRRLIALVACAALVLASCSDDGDDGDPAAATTTTADSGTEPADGSSTTTPTTERRPDPAAEAAMERAQGLNLTVEDFPSGWQNLPQAESEVGVVELCTNVDLDAHLTALARSDAFSYTIEPGTLQASSSVSILDEEEAAADMIADFRDDEFVQCATESLSRDTDTYTIDGALSRNESSPDLGDEAVALSGDFTITPTDDSPPHTLSAAVVATRKGDTVVIFSSTATDRGFDEETTRTLLTAIDERIEA